MIKKLKRISKAEVVVNHFKNQLQKGIIKTGDTLPSKGILIENLLINYFNLSKGLTRLYELRIIQVLYKKGSVVCERVNAAVFNDAFLSFFSDPQLKNFMHLIEARIVLEKAMFVKIRTEKDIALLHKII